MPSPHELIPGNYFARLTRQDIFPDASRPLEIDVGCGDGTFLLEMAARFPERDFLGVERLGGRVAKICRRADRLGIPNVRVLCLESSYALGWLLPISCASRLHLLFPDPWPKKRHAWKRFVQPEILGSIHQTLAPHGEFLFKTDHTPYFEEATATVDASPLFSRLPWLRPEEFYPLTDFEKQWISAGCQISAARWLKTENNPAPDAKPGSAASL